MRATTIHETADGLRTALIEYIEAAYHIADPALLRQRQALLESRGVIHQTPFLESTPRYPLGQRFETIPGLPAAALRALQALSQPDADGKVVLYDPPYQHQSDALHRALVARKNLLIMTGTGSGKTESFLMPIVGALAQEASEAPGSFAQPAMRSMVLYPMNALVNDQLARLRAIFGDARLVELFKGWGSGRPPRFTRYTSRTPYAGLRETEKDRQNLRQFRDFYIGALEDCQSDDEQVRGNAFRLVRELKSRGKWPAKPDLAAWYGAYNARWQNTQGEFKRAVTLPADSELVTRHEAQTAAPDLMVTNYSMLEYMLMRPVERPIFDQTSAWLEANPTQVFRVVLDEAHLYRGAAGAEVGLLLRRLRDRLRISVDRFQVICATASFDSEAYAPQFASQLTGTKVESFEIIKSTYLKRDGEGVGSVADAELLASLDMSRFFSADGAQQALAIEPFLQSRGVSDADATVEQRLYQALKSFAPLALLVNMTMKCAQPLEELGGMIFPQADKDVGDRALSNLATLATNARRLPEGPSLLPGRVHTFFRGLRGLWACMDENCSEVEPSLQGVVGKLYTQPMDLCRCGARVLEIFTCRLCGTAYARGYCTQAKNPSVIWAEPGAELRTEGEVSESLQAVDMMLSEPVVENLSAPAFYDMVTGSIGVHSSRIRTVHLSTQGYGQSNAQGEEEEDTSRRANLSPGVFHVCGGCNRRGLGGSSPVQDHETTGDQPFQVLVNRQLQLQPPSKPETPFAPLRGRKVLVFSDSRQVAARLAPNLQMFAARDSLRPLIAYGWWRLAQVPNLSLRLADLYGAVAIAAHHLGVRLRPELAPHEQFDDYEAAGQLVRDGFESDDVIREVCEQFRQGDGPPDALLADILMTVRDRSLGLEALALASIVERADKQPTILALPNVPGVTETDDDRLQLARAWFRQWQHAGFWLAWMGQHWYRVHPNRKVRVMPLSGTFPRFLSRLPTPAAKKIVKEKWLPALLDAFATHPERQHRLEGKFLSLSFGGEWVRCEDCKSVHRPVRLLPVCPDCGRGNVIPMDPDADDAFRKRKGYYRNTVTAVLRGDRDAAMSLVAAEHTAQLNSAQKEEVFSKAEINELLFQDVELPTKGRVAWQTAIDVLSSTTTMEVGIDIGQLSGVALRNMPPGRANYQQRAGRAGRRGKAIASVVAFGGSDTHDEHFFSHPAEMIAGPVIDPKLSLNNADIARRHLRAFLLQCYIQARVLAPEQVKPNLFSVLGTVDGFLKPTETLNRQDFETWLRQSSTELRARADAWLPTELDARERQELLENMVEECLTEIDHALGATAAAGTEPSAAEADGGPEVQAEVEDARPPASPASANLLDALLYKGILPRYAFPTDVSTFHVFDNARSTLFRPIFEFAPSQSTPVALSQYAPGKQVWIAGRCYVSGAIYSPMRVELREQWGARKLQLECGRCGYTCLVGLGGEIGLGARIDCVACRGELTLGPARHWFRPVGFAHPQEQPALLSPDEIPETTYATRAKLIMESGEANGWTTITDRIRYCKVHTHLLVSNNGPARRGYTFCEACGRIESTASSIGALSGPHFKPYPDPGKQTCRGGRAAREVVLGTDFITDVALFSLKVASPVRLLPADSITRLALRTLCEALSRAATELLQIEAGEVMAEFRPAVTAAGCEGLEAEIFLYDTLPGGAGFAQQAAAKGTTLFAEARRIMAECPENCDLSCYRCLRSFRNRIDHGVLDRHTGMALIDYLVSGSLQDFNADRLLASSKLLLADLERQGGKRLALSIGTEFVDDQGHRHLAPIRIVSSNGVQQLASVVNPLRQLNSPRLVRYEGAESTLIEVNELVVRKSLAEASRTIFGGVNSARQ
ncbi:DEAD/DEAH box helicase [Metallibacterium sp.]|uniref:DEAD/DEAH box helicase n=1 Tax=Metallibacterium sp. TaxID=2940281 RepID=UPI0026382A11|nr:DEAD/DEAH box helicase [Metallibacterium sp.]